MYIENIPVMFMSTHIHTQCLTQTQTKLPSHRGLRSATALGLILGLTLGLTQYLTLMMKTSQIARVPLFSLERQTRTSTAEISASTSGKMSAVQLGI